MQSAPTLLLTTIGLLFTGELLDHVSKWRAMREVDQLIILIPVVLNLKGNLEMNLSARLGTAANMGELDDRRARRDIILGNLSLLQVQAGVVSFVAAGVALLLGLVLPRIHPEIAPTDAGARKSGFPTFILVSATATAAACLSSIVLGSFMCSMIVLCRHFGWDPDNIAPPVASCLGDLVTLLLLAFVSSVLILFRFMPYISGVVVLLVASIAVACLFLIVRKNKHVAHLIYEGWSPLFGAMAISCATGTVLDLFVSRYEGFALLAVVISGLPGSVGAIFVSRLSTALHVHTSQAPSAKLVAWTLLLITIPVEIIFLAVLRGLGWLHLPFPFVVLSVLFFCCAVMISLVIARLLTNFLWVRSLDPDTYALPVHSALMDLVGQLLLVICFEIASAIGAEVQTKAAVSVN
ncbi:hypothetical protein FISHEDRAFT_52057 [Fistulina hepatica ATCC 64428]|nr:hypothetical protein FISHEDRAFT_52057 [Fistulina hepatica ATCC 64428]